MFDINKLDFDKSKAALQHNTDYFNKFYKNGPFDNRFTFWLNDAGDLCKGPSELPASVSRMFDDLIAAIAANALPMSTIHGVDAVRFNGKLPELVELKHAMLNPYKYCMTKKGTLYFYSGTHEHITSKKTFESIKGASYKISNNNTLYTKNMPTIILTSCVISNRFISLNEMDGETVVSHLETQKAKERSISLRNILKSKDITPETGFVTFEAYVDEMKSKMTKRVLSSVVTVAKNKQKRIKTEELYFYQA